MKYSKSQWFNIFNNTDWIKIEKDFPSLAFLMRCSTDHFWVESITNKQTTPENSNLLSDTLSVASTIGITVPVIGLPLLILSEIIGGLNLSVYSEISHSNIASKRLIEWSINSRKNYGMPQNNNLPLNILLDNINKMNKHTSLLVPKCISPSNNCVTEHTRYQQRVTMVRESQETVLKLYFQYIDDIDQLEMDFGKDYQGQNINPNVNKSSLTPIALILAGLFFSKGL
jgi:hypothetical protein